MSRIITQEEVNRTSELHTSYLNEEYNNSNLEKPKDNYIISVYLNGGHVLNVECEDWKLTSNPDGSFSGYSFSGMKKGEQVSFSIPDIVAVKSVKVD